MTDQPINAVPDLRARIEGLRERAQRQGTWGIEYGDDRLLDDVLRIIDAATPPSATEPAGLRDALEAIAAMQSDAYPEDELAGQAYEDLTGAIEIARRALATPEPVEGPRPNAYDLDLDGEQ